MPASERTTPALRVLMTADAVGGVWQYALDAAQGMRAHGVETTLAVLGPAPSDDQTGQAEALGIEVIMTDLPLDWTADHAGAVRESGRAVARLAAEIQPDIVHLNSPALFAGADFACPVVAVCHSCVATWWDAVRGGSLPGEFVWRTELVRQGYQRADTLLAPTAAFADATARVYGLARAPTVVRNGRQPITERNSRRHALFAFTAGRLWDEGKNFAAVDRAASRLSLPILAAGPLEGPNGARMTARHATALGRLSDAEVASYLSAQPIFVSAARYEPFGLAVLEAAQAGCALVLSDIPTLRELWEDAALFVDPDDDEAIARSIDRLAADDDARRAMGKAASDRASIYSLESMSTGLLSAYMSLLPSKVDPLSLKGAVA
ncbi:glycosyltransferase family 4 protein [Microvirga makkahensis]|uniref:Glycosyltransferase n=1 Tax=Microvirga makkahensis TaxID=1128670 RepID=A0A7X3MQP5_9HYPH|nr:glycosyltransferase family 4 protein [Microvirga makkahensis]MXQ11444.1 glycosyltransferase [Microvirga makkahensis]